MRKLTAVILSLFILLMPFCATEVMAEQEEIPSLVSIEFNNAKINEEISKDVNKYTLTLDSATSTPTLKSYEISGSAQLFVNYKLDEAMHQTGVVVTLEYVGGSVEYTFDYTNASYDKTSGNNLLADISCPNCKVYPEINDKTVNYKLFIPSDLTELNISTVTQDINAYCDLPKSISLAADQEPEFTITVTAANGKTRVYKLQVKRVDKNTNEVAGEIKTDGEEAIVSDELFFKKPEFLVTAGCIAGGILLIAVILAIIKRITVKPEDEEEPEFFDGKE